VDKVNDSLIDRLRTDAEWFAVPSSHYYHNELWETRDLLREAANALVAQNKPCTDAKEQEHGCLRAVKAENELAAQKEQFRVLTDEMLVMMDERNAAARDAKENMDIANEFKRLMEEYRQREADANKALRVAVGLLSTMPQFSNMHPNDVLEGILKETREMK